MLFRSEPKTGKTVKAKDGDQVLIDFVGKIDGVAFDGGTAQDTPLVLGSGSFIPGFEEQLVGAKPDSDVVVKVTFPAEYQAANLAGKDAEFEVDVKEIRARAPMEINDKLAQRLGLQTLDELKTALKERLSQEYSQVARQRLKRNLLDALADKVSFEVPSGMVNDEFKAIWNAMKTPPNQIGRAHV